MSAPSKSANALTEREANLAYDVLVRYGQAKENVGDRASFVLHAKRGLDEWRFIGSLGFGGKIRCRIYPERELHVNCYPEDLTPEREAFIAFLNDVALAAVLGG